MTEYETYRVTLEVKSSVITPFQADTLFGTLCWGIRFLETEDDLKKFIKLSLKKDPPLIISDAFPENYLPNPILAPLKIKESKELAKTLYSKGKKDLIRGIMKLKELSKLDLIPKAYLSEHIENLSSTQIGKGLLLEKLKEPVRKSQANLRNTFNRLTARVQEGGLFSETETYYRPESPESRVNFYVKLDENLFTLTRLKDILTGYLEISGYGADKSVGRGNVKFIGIEDTNLPHANQPNAFMSLSSFIPRADDPSNGFYNPVLKYGKLGEHYASGEINKINRNGQKIGMNPFKKPLYMFRAGSTFFLDGKLLEEYYGRIIENIHWDTEIIHYGLAFPLGIRIIENTENLIK